MRRLLISVAVLALATAPAFAQPGQEHGHGHRDSNPGQGGGEHGGGEHGGGHGGPDTGRPSGPPQAQPQAQMREQGPPPRGGPTSFTNQVQGHQPDQGQRPERGFEEGRGHRGPEAAPQLQAAPQQVQRGPNRPEGRPDFGYRGDNGRDYRAGDRNFNRPGNPDNGPSFASRPGNPTFGGPRRDFSGFRDFHRDFRSGRRFRIGPYRPPAGFYGHHWTFGEFLPRPYWVRDYWLLDFDAYGLPPPPYGAVWVRVGSDALLIDEYSGEIITVAYDVFY